MKGGIRDEDIATVRDRVRVEQIIGEAVTLVNAGGGNLKGLCPFHSEKSPSFTVSTSRNVWYCFGCSAGGDAISFLMQLDHLTFIEAVGQLADRLGIELRPADPSAPGVVRQEPGQRARLLAAHTAAGEFYRDHMTGSTPGVGTARTFLAERGFGRDHVEKYGIGFAPGGWDALSKHLLARGFTADELTTAGLAKPGQRGLIDRFRRRLLWPITDPAGHIIGFGARKLFDDDDGPKYLNTPETPLYKKSNVLYGVEFSRREIARLGRAVIVEGYTDVMACHEAGEGTAVATCGTAFGAEHIAILRRIMHDTAAAEIIYTFDGDAAGQKAAMRAFEADQSFLARTYIAVSPGGMDPCELRLAAGDAAVAQMVADRQPLVDFAIGRTIGNYDITAVAGRVDAMRAVAPLIGKIKDRDLRPEYARQVAADLGMDITQVLRAVSDAESGQVRKSAAGPEVEPTSPRDYLERETLKIALQFPELLTDSFDRITHCTGFTGPYAAELATAVVQSLGERHGLDPAAWVARLHERCADAGVISLLNRLAVEPIDCPADDPDTDYAAAILGALEVASLQDRIEQGRFAILGIDPISQHDAYFEAMDAQFRLEAEIQKLRSGGPPA